jgi:hypothetical protein
MAIWGLTAARKRRNPPAAASARPAGEAAVGPPGTPSLRRGPRKGCRAGQVPEGVRRRPRPLTSVPKEAPALPVEEVAPRVEPVPEAAPPAS